MPFDPESIVIRDALAEGAADSATGTSENRAPVGDRNCIPDGFFG
jgi:hypothetical protein